MVASDPFFLPAGTKKKQNKKRTLKEEKYTKDDDNDDEATMTDIDDLDLEHRLESEAAESDDDFKKESAQEKRIRLARNYLDDLNRQVEQERNEIDAAQLDRDLVAERLQKDVLETVGRLKYVLADKLPEEIPMTAINKHRTSVTAVAISPNDRFAFSAAKDGLILQYDIATKRQIYSWKPGKRSDKKHAGHTDMVLALAVSHDDQFLASGGVDKKICIWNLETHTLITTFTHHRDAVTGLGFRRGSNMLYSASKDRTVKVFNLDEMTYVETLFGHQDSITSLSSMGLRDRCLTTGGRDRTVRLWKIPEESQLLFRASAVGYHPSTVSIAQVTCDTDFSEDENGAKDKRTSVLAKDVTGSVDVVACIDDETWISGSDGGTLCIWNAQRKKPIFTLPNAHGMCVQMGEEKMENGCRSYQFVDRESDASLIASADEAARNGFVAIGNWICAIDAPMNTDLVVSGSCDGTLRFWKFSHHRYGRRNQVLKLVKKVEVPGYINSLAFSPSLNYLIVGVGQEPRTGRWSRISTGRNGIRIIDLSGLAEAIPGK